MKTDRLKETITVAVLAQGILLLIGCATGQQYRVWEEKRKDGTPMQVIDYRQYCHHPLIPAIFPSVGKLKDAELKGIDIPDFVPKG